MVVMVRGAAQQMNPNVRVPLRDATAPAPKVAILIVWDKAIRDAVAAAKAGPMDATVSAHIARPTMQSVRLRNVVGVLRGSDPQLKDTYVIVTGHYDHLGVRPNAKGDGIYNGANDDASGTASVIAVAGALASLEERPKRATVSWRYSARKSGLARAGIRAIPSSRDRCDRGRYQPEQLGRHR